MTSFNTFSNGTVTGGLGIYDQEVLPSAGLFAMRQDPTTLKGQFSNNGGTWQDFEAGGTPVAITGGSNINVSLDISGNYVVATVGNPLFGTVSCTTMIASGALSADTCSIGTGSIGSLNAGNLTVPGTLTYTGPLSVSNINASGTLNVLGSSSLRNTNITGTLGITSTISCVDISSGGNIGASNITTPNAFHTNIFTSNITTGGLASLAGPNVQVTGTDSTNATWRIGTPSLNLIGIGGDSNQSVAIGYYNPLNTTFNSRFMFSQNGNFGVGTNVPSEALNVVGNALVTGTVNSRNMTTDGATLDTLNSRVNQPLNILSSPSFAALTLGQLNTPNMQIKNSPSSNSCQINNPNVNGVIRFASNNTEFIAMTNDSIYLSNLRAYASSITLRSNMPCDPGVLIDGRDISVDGTALDLVVSRVNQDVKNTASPTWGQINSTASTSRWLVGYSTAIPGTAHTALEYYGPNMTGSTVQMLFGRDSAANGSAVIKHQFVSGLSGDNSCNIGLTGNENILSVHGEGYIKGTNMVLQGSGKALSGGLRINSGTSKFEYYNGSTWIAPESTVATTVPSLTVTAPSSSSITLTNNGSNQSFINFVGDGAKAIRSKINGSDGTSFIIPSSTNVIYDYFRFGTNSEFVVGAIRNTNNIPEVYSGSAWLPLKPVTGVLMIQKSGGTITASIIQLNYGASMTATYNNTMQYVEITIPYDVAAITPTYSLRNSSSAAGVSYVLGLTPGTGNIYIGEAFSGGRSVTWLSLSDFTSYFNVAFG